MNDYEKENFERVEDQDRYDRVVPIKFAALGIPAALWMGVIFFYPWIWAIGTATALVMALGYGTTKGILKIRSNKKALALAPVIGTLWVGFFYLLFELFEN
jgi:hypothetical protein